MLVWLKWLMHSKFYILHSSRGFSIIEISIAVIIISILSIIIAKIFIAHSDLSSREQTSWEIQFNNSLAQTKIKDSILEATKVMMTKTINATSYTSGANTLILELPSIDTAGDIISEKYDYTVFYLNPSDETQLLTSLEADGASSRTSSSDRTIAHFIAGIIFRYNAPQIKNTTLVSIFLKNSKTRGKLTQNFSSTTSVRLYNK